MTPRSGGGWKAILYSLRMARRVGLRRVLAALFRKNACKTCALGMGGQKGGMVNEQGHFPEVCKKSFQAMVADMQGEIRPDFFRAYSLDQLRRLSPRELEWCGRLTTPVLAAPGDTHYRPIGWDEALDRLAASLRDSGPEGTFFYASGRSSNEAGFLLQLFARLFGTNYVNNCSYYCHQASGVGLSESLGVGTATVTLEDIDHADLFFLIGGNPASNHPRLMRSLMHLRRRGGKVVVVNPVKEPGLVDFSVPSDLLSLLFGSSIASLYVQPHIGGDIAFLTGIAKFLIAAGAVATSFLDQATAGYEAFRAGVEAASWDDLVRCSGVDRETMRQAAELYRRSRRAIFGWTMGITHHEHGVNNVRAIVNTALLRGMVGKPGAGLLPIRGHSNVQGLGTVGVVPTLKERILANLETLLGRTLPRSPGMDTMACMEAAAAGTMRTAVCLGGNLFGSNPDAAFARRALGNVDTVAYLNTTLNTGHAWGTGKTTLILPVLARDEEGQKTTQESMFNYVRLSDGGPRRYEGPRAEVTLLADLAQRVLGDEAGIDWSALRSHCHLREMIARAIPGLEGLADIDRTGREFQIPGRTFHVPRFATPDGKARFAALEVPSRVEDEGLVLMTVRSEGQFNTVVYEEEDVYRGQERRDVILLHPDDMRRLGLSADQPVTVTSAAGSLAPVRVRPFDIRPGNALMYYPEANVLVPRTVDGRSKTPAFKAVRVTLSPLVAGRLELSIAAGRGP